MNYSEAKDKVYELISKLSYDNSVFYGIQVFGFDIEEDPDIKNAEKKYLCQKIDNVTSYYYNKIILSRKFLSLNNNFKTAANYTKFLRYYYYYLPKGKSKGELFKRICKDLKSRKDILKQIEFTVTEFLIRIEL